MDAHALELLRRRDYARGYNAGRRGSWPDHRPPTPPDEIVAAFMDATMKLRNAVDGELATLDGGDEWTKRLGPLVDAVDEQFIAIGRWLTRDQERPTDLTP